MRVVLDTNVLVSGIISAHGPPAKLIDAWLRHRFALLTSVHQLDEFQRVLGYPKIASRIDRRHAAALIDGLRRAVVIEGVSAPGPPALTPDVDDNLLLGLAIQGRATMLVTGDRAHLLGLGAVDGIPIVSPRAAMRIVIASDQPLSD